MKGPSVNPTGKIAVVGSRYNADPKAWLIYPIGRETAARIYAKDVKAPGWGGDPHESKERIVGRFDSEAEAKAFIAAGCDVYSRHEAEVVAAVVASNKAREALGAANRARADAVRQFVSGSGGGQ